MAHTAAERFVPDEGERGIKKGLARHVGHAGLLCLVFYMHAVGTVGAVHAGPDNTSPTRTGPAAGSLPPNAPEERLPSDEELAAGGAVIGEIVIRNENIFDISDPRENNWLFRLTNKLHARTRPWLIRNQLLFRTGDANCRRGFVGGRGELGSDPHFF